MNYTIVGYFENDGKPWIEYASADTAAEAIDMAVRGLQTTPDRAYELVVLCVFEGITQPKYEGPLYVGDAEQFEDMFEED